MKIFHERVHEERHLAEADSRSRCPGHRLVRGKSWATGIWRVWLQLPAGRECGQVAGALGSCVSPSREGASAAGCQQTARGRLGQLSEETALCSFPAFEEKGHCVHFFLEGGWGGNRASWIPAKGTHAPSSGSYQSKHWPACWAPTRGSMRDSWLLCLLPS